MILHERADDVRSPRNPHHAESEQAVLGGVLRDNAAIDRVELAEADFYSTDHRSSPGLPGESCEGDVVSPFKRVSMIDMQANLMQKAFAAGRMDDARAHCKIFTELARERAASFLNGGTGAPGLRNSFAQACHHPIQKELPRTGGEGK